jgi:hypothetical protein
MTASTTAPEPRSGLLERLRSVVPQRALTPNEALHVAERQAALLLASLGVGAPPVPQRALAELPFLSIDHRPGLPTSGMATRTDSGWVIVLKSDEPSFRKAFSLAHELKHVLDDPFIEWLYPRTQLQSAHERAELICNYFAACLLMPKKLVVKDWCSGVQGLERLASRYRVSRQAMSIRLFQLGLLAPTPRCLPAQGAVA